MSENDEDSHNQGEEEQISKIPKPASLNHYFGKIQANPKLWQLEAKLKPNASDKYTKWTFKTNNKQFMDWAWMNNSKLKFQTKEGKTKLSVTAKMFDSVKRHSKQKQGEQISMRQSSEKEKQHKPKDQNHRNRDSGQIDVNFSTSYDDSKINIKLKDRGQINFKFSQAIDLIPNTLSANLEYVWEYKNKTDAHKYTAEMMYTTGVAKWINGRASTQANLQQETVAGSQPLLEYQKNETKIKAKISNHSDTQLKVTSINHFGEINQKPLQPQEKAKPKQSDESNQVESELPVKEQKVKSSESSAQTEVLRTKLSLENKLTIFKKQSDGFNFKTSLGCELTALKQSVNFQTIVNHSGLHNIQCKYICKRWRSFIFGGMVGINWNTHASQWHKKWEAVIEKQDFFKVGNMALSFSDKYAGIRLMKRLTKNSRVEIMASRKWNLGIKDIPNIGIKINLNW